MKPVRSIIDGIYQHEKPDIFQKMGIDTIVDDTGAIFKVEATINRYITAQKTGYF